ncbi:MAG: AAA family ATPase [bacterium]
MDLIPAIIIDTDDGARYTLKTNVEASNIMKVIGDYNNHVAGYNAVIQEKPAVVFLDVSENLNLSIEIIEKICLHHRFCIIFVSSYESSPEIIIKAMRAGAREFLTKPIDSHVLMAALKKAKTLLTADPTYSQSSKIFTVFSNKGGIGKTTIATNLAVSLADITGKKVALVDLNLQLGDITTFLDISPSFDISYVVTQLSRVDEAFLLSTLEKYKNKELYILADPPYLEQAEEITSEQVATVLSILKSVFSYVVIDTSSNFDNQTLCALDMADNILLVSMINLPSIRNSQRCLELFERLNYTKDQTKLIINRYVPDNEITVEDVEDALGHSIYWKIPNNYFTVISSINRGIPLSMLEADSNISKNFMELAALLSNTVLATDKANEKSEKSLFKFNIFKFFGKNK